MLVPYMWKFLPGKNFLPISLIGKIYITRTFCPVFMITLYIEDMVTFTALAKIYFTEYYCDTKVHM